MTYLFQLSFVAVLYIILILPLLKNISRDISYRQLVIIYIWNSIWVTGSVLVGIWPILLTHFHQLSLEVFWLNIIMLPMLAFLILPGLFYRFIHQSFQLAGIAVQFLGKNCLSGSGMGFKNMAGNFTRCSLVGEDGQQFKWNCIGVAGNTDCIYLTTILLLRNLAQKKRRDSRKF